MNRLSKLRFSVRVAMWKFAQRGYAPTIATWGIISGMGAFLMLATLGSTSAPAFVWEAGMSGSAFVLLASLIWLAKINRDNALKALTEKLSV